MGLSYSGLKSFGFNISGSESTDWYGRYNYNTTVYIKTMH